MILREKSEGTKFVCSRLGWIINPEYEALNYIFILANIKIIHCYFNNNKFVI